MEGRKMKKFSEKPTGILCSADLKTFKGKIFYWVMFAVLVILCAAAILPTLWVILTAFKDTQEIYQGISFFPKNLTPEIAVQRVKEAWGLLKIQRVFVNTLVLSLGNVVFTLVVCGLGGYVISKLKPKGTKLIFALIVWTMMMPSQMRIVPLFMSFLSFPLVGKFPWEVSLINTYWPMWLNAAANSFNIVLFKNYFDSIPVSYIEAAKLDGCNDIKTFFKIMLPLSMPIVIYISIMSMSSGWTEFFMPYLVLSDKDLRTLPVMIYSMKSDTSVKMNTYMMALVFSSIPPFVIFVLFQRHIMGGINIGGVKG